MQKSQELCKKLRVMQEKSGLRKKRHDYPRKNKS